MGGTKDGTSRRPALREVECKSILGESGICDWSLNCYTGCAHGCTYCYARFMGRFHRPAEAWGSFVDAKVNSPQVLARQLGRRKRPSRGTVFVSSVCDPYQPAEEKFQLTRKCLFMLLEADFEVHIQTKSSLAQRDFDLLTGRENVSFCETITTMDEDLAGEVEPHAAPPAERVKTLRAARQAGIPAKAFVGPVLPQVSDTSAGLGAVFSQLAELELEELYVDRLNLRWGVWPSLQKTLRRIAPKAVAPTRAVLFDQDRSGGYSRELRGTVRRAAQAAGIEAPLTLLF